jgi:Tol biopolymer transport system component
MIGTRLGPYEITAKLGQGGMGEVYRATDSRLRREVAIKVLPPAFTADRERLARFEREAQTLASLNHPNIAAVHGLEESAGVRALVMELVDGEDLSAVIARGALPLAEALPIARQIAEALEAAHERGIVHRDLKPANIKLATDGTAKVLDFGLAKATEPPGAGSSAAGNLLAHSPTLTAAHGTELGVILGTAAYMAPEQARGGAVDRRADVWAFGVVLYEMLVGRRLFEGETVSDTLAAVLRQEVDWSALPAATPAALRRLLRLCLERNPRNRLHDIADARIALDELLSGRADADVSGVAASAGSRARPAGLRWLPWAIAALAGCAAILATALHVREPAAEEPRTIRFQVQRPDSNSSMRRGSGFELSPDGRWLAIAVAGELFVRPLDSVSARRLEGVAEATYPFWSPDSAWIGFFADGQLMKVAREGGAVMRVCDAPEGRGATWGQGGDIVFSQDQGRSALSRVSADGGPTAAALRLPPLPVNHFHRYPQFLPDGRRFIFQHLADAPEVAGIYLGTLDGDTVERILEGPDQALYAPPRQGAGPGHLLFRRNGSTLLAQPFDPDLRRTVGPALPVADGVGLGLNTGSGAFTVSRNGVLAFSADWEASGELVWVDRAGQRLGVANAETRELKGMAVSRGARRLAFSAGLPSTDIWVQVLPEGEPSRFTFGPPPGWAYPVWSPDGSELAYATWDLVGVPRYEIRRRRADRSGDEETLLRTPTVLYPWDWSPDGASIVYGDDADLLLLPLAGERSPVPLVAGPGLQTCAQLSPDGHLVAYVSNEQGRFEVFVGTVPSSGAVWQISTGGGSMPRWRRDGGELYFRAVDGTLMVVALGAADGSAAAAAAAIEERTAPRPLFAGIPSEGNIPQLTYSPSDDGQRFLVSASRDAAQPPITVVVEWQAALERRPAGREPR